MREAKFLDPRRVDKSGDCWEWRGAKTYGYGYFEGERAHRVSIELFLGPIPSGKLVCHRCHNKGCIKPSHLFVGTSLENNRDISRINAKGPPRKHPWDEMAKLHEEGMSVINIGKRFGCTRNVVYRILNEVRLNTTNRR